MANQTEIRELHASDGVTLGITIYRCLKVRRVPVAVVTPAMGAAASFYEPLAQALSVRGSSVVTADLRGVGLSSVRAGRGTDFGSHEIISFDLPAVVDDGQTLFPSEPLFLLATV